jgi:hypothetical protein
MVLVICGFSVLSSRRRNAKSSACFLLDCESINRSGMSVEASCGQASLAPSTYGREKPDVYRAVEYHARNVKAVLQMIVGIIAVSVVGWHFLDTPIHQTHQAISLLINSIGVGLAAAAVIELAYTLFTPGPDEALDPLMLALAATLLAQVASLEGTPTVGKVASLLLQGVLLAVLFAIRLMLVERNDEDDDLPNIWWIWKKHDRKCQRP